MDEEIGITEAILPDSDIRRGPEGNVSSDIGAGTRYVLSSKSVMPGGDDISSRNLCNTKHHFQLIRLGNIIVVHEKQVLSIRMLRPGVTSSTQVAVRLP